MCAGALLTEVETTKTVPGFLERAGQAFIFADTGLNKDCAYFICNLNAAGALVYNRNLPSIINQDS